MINKKPDLLVNKFHDRWFGPLKVTTRCSDLVYKILDADFGKTKRVHFNLLKAASRKNVRDDIGQNEPATDTNEESFEEEVPFIDEVPTLPPVSTAAMPAGTQNGVTAKTAAPNQPAADHLASQPQATNNSAVPDAPIQVLAAEFAAIPAVNPDHASILAAPIRVDSVVPQRGGALRYEPPASPNAVDKRRVTNYCGVNSVNTVSSWLIAYLTASRSGSQQQKYTKLLSVDRKCIYVGSISISPNFSVYYANSTNRKKRSKTFA